MGKATLKVTLKAERNDVGEQNIRIRITKDRASSYWSLPLSVTARQFNPNGRKDLQNWVRPSHLDAGSYNHRILDDLIKAEKAIGYFDGLDREYSAADVTAYLRQGGLPETLLGFFAQHCTKRRKQAGNDLGKLRTADNYESTLKVLRWYVRETGHISDRVTDEELDKRQILPLRSLGKTDILDLRAWLHTNYSHNSVVSYLTHLRKVLYEAADRGLVSYESFPMRGIKFGVVRKKVQRLYEDEIEQLATAELPKKKRRGAKPAVTDFKHARPLTLAMYLCHGARIGDAIAWRVHNYYIEPGPNGLEHRLRYKTGKTDKDMSVLLDEEAIELLEPYRFREDGTPKKPNDFLFPYLPANLDRLPVDEQYRQIRNAKSRAREQIRRLGEQVGLTKRITPHIMRHSLADMMRREGVDLETRQNVLGHSDIRTTRNYEEQFDQTAVDSVSLLYQKRRKAKQENK